MNVVDALTMNVPSKTLAAASGLSARQIRKARQGKASVLAKIKDTPIQNINMVEAKEKDYLAEQMLNSKRDEVRRLEFEYTLKLKIQNEILDRLHATDEEIMDVTGKQRKDCTKEVIEAVKRTVDFVVVNEVQQVKIKFNFAMGEARLLGYNHQYSKALKRRLDDAEGIKFTKKAKNKKQTADVHNPNVKFTSADLVAVVGNAILESVISDAKGMVP